MTALQDLYLHGFSGFKFELFQTTLVLFLECTVLCFVCFLSALLLTALVCSGMASSCEYKEL